MKLFLDSTYFFPTLKVAVEGVPFAVLSHLLDLDVQLYYSSLTLFELQAKGARYVQKNQLMTADVIEGVLSVQMEPRLNQIVPYNLSQQIELAINLRYYHKDYIDCLIAASAIYHGDVLLSEDKILKSLFQREEIESHLIQKNLGNLRIYNWAEFSKESL